MPISEETALRISRQLKMLVSDARAAELKMTLATLEFAVFAVEADVEQLRRGAHDAIAR